MLKKLMLGLGAILFALLAAVGAALYATLPPRHAQIAIAGLSAPVAVSFDQHGIPFIKARNLTDAATALGYIHARDRLFQMDLMRRQASGRLAELFGPAALPLDREARILGWQHHAEQDYPALPAATRAMLDAYARGVNAYIAQKGRFAAPEFLIFGKPAPWLPTDSLLWGKTMQAWLSENARIELARLALSRKLSQTQIDQLWPSDDKWMPPDASFSTALVAQAAHVLGWLPDFPDPFTKPATASNEWAVAGSRTRSGAPLLAGDPHLDLSYPSVWYLARIDTPDDSLAGVTGAGLPFLVMGHNRALAWTFTNNGADVEDVFIETVLPDGRYQTPQGPRPFITRREVIHVKGAPDQILMVRETRHGPVISDEDPKPGGPVLAVEEAELQPGDTAASGIFALDRAQTIQQAQQAAQLIDSPVQNLLVADRHHIALLTTGRVPVRAAGDGSMPVSGADGRHDWVGWASGLALPHYQDPASGELVNGNERTAPPDFPVFMARDSYGGWRARRIRQLLGDRTGLTVADFEKIQNDDVSLLARELLPVLRAAAPHDGSLSARAAALLAGWNGVMDRHLPQPLIYNAWVRQFYADVLARAGARQWNGPWAEFTSFVLSPRGAGWCGGDCVPMLRASLTAALTPLAARFGNDPARWQWGQIHKAEFYHPVLGQLASAMPWLRPLAGFSVPVDGDDQTINRGGSAGLRLTSNHGPAYRGVFDLSDLDHGSRFAMTSGESGNLLSRHAGDLMRGWSLGQYFAIAERPERVSATLRLVP